MNEAPAAKDWSNLPNDISELVIRSLNFVDSFHLACTCKNWLSMVRTTRRRSDTHFGNPCLFLLVGEGKSCHLLDPLFKDKYIIPTPKLPSPVKILFCKGGWLLMLANDEESIFFFNPVTKATIDLPKFDIASVCAFSFSHIPTSPDCVVMAISASWDVDCGIFLCRRGAKDWDEKDVYDNNFEFNVSHTTPVFHKGCFYCLGNNGRIGVFDYMERTWTVMERPDGDKSLSHRLYLTELDGELLWVRTNLMGDSVHICKLDSVSNKWKSLDSLGERCLFVSKVASICPKELVTAERRNGVYFGMIQDEDFVFYSCVARKLCPRGDFDGAKDYSYSSCWIEPVFSQPSSEELTWE